ncbi:MAG: hypothetical protein ACK56F_24090, partial [bacterium]
MRHPRRPPRAGSPPHRLGPARRRDRPHRHPGARPPPRPRRLPREVRALRRLPCERALQGFSDQHGAGPGASPLPPPGPRERRPHRPRRGHLA